VLTALFLLSFRIVFLLGLSSRAGKQRFPLAPAPGFFDIDDMKSVIDTNDYDDV
jgi:hypothetical protein